MRTFRAHKKLHQLPITKTVDLSHVTRTRAPDTSIMASTQLNQDFTRRTSRMKMATITILSSIGLMFNRHFYIPSVENVLDMHKFLTISLMPCNRDLLDDLFKNARKAYL
ncbi:hypothetical protein Moror_14963 [Moniliophthora roreri MCA 2997]|uniref:Uncharacterized protein n=1 Tax=Moniliophthora roreri (strain MCA 2997) TaxID=1381753 RepID=V2WDD7_MONRO|nr:hypothetical protein Moror_14963 [Moniliophthora roreri MCA 2997]